MTQHSKGVLKNETVSAIKKHSRSMIANSAESFESTETPESDSGENFLPVQTNAGRLVKQFWSGDSQHYPGQINEISDRKHQFAYDGGDVEDLNKSQKT